MLQPGALINQRYQIVRQVGQGGFGFVYEARDIRLAKTVALKQTRFTDAQRKQAFEREAQLLAQLKHAGLPPVTDHFSDADGQFLVMEFIPGDDLATKLQQRGGPFPLAQVLQWADQLLEILAYLHNHQPPVCHYDIKPGNLKLAPDGSLMLLDFGLAKSSDSRASGFSDDYSPIEQFAGTGTDARSDLYAAGATLYHLLVGTPPPNAPTRSIAVHQNRKPDPLRPPHSANPAIPLAVSVALVQALELNPADRPASVTELRAALGTASSSSAGAPTQVIPPQGSALGQAPLQPPKLAARLVKIAAPPEVIPPQGSAPGQAPLQPPKLAARLVKIAAPPEVIPPQGSAPGQAPLQPPKLAARLVKIAAPPEVIPPQGSAPGQAPLQPPIPVGAPTIPVRPPPAPPKGPPFMLWPGMLLAVVLVGAFLVFANRGGTPAAPPTTSAPAVATVAVAMVPTAVPSTVAPTAVSPTAVPPTTAPAALPAWVPELVKVPAGPFLMGSTDQQIAAVISQGAQADWVKYEKSQHTLTLPDYWIGKTEVTNAQFRPFVDSDGYTNQAYWTAAGWAWRQAENITQPLYWNDAKWNGPDYPVVGVSWFEAVAYCRWLSKQTGIAFRLPSEAEWEKAARGSDGLIYPWGNTWETGRANSNESGLNQTTPVGTYPTGASPYGALDMAGNVWEWCATQWSKPYPYQLEDEWQAAYLEADATYRMFRGGSSWDNSIYVRGAYRLDHNPRFRLISRGMRVTSHALVP